MYVRAIVALLLFALAAAAWETYIVRVNTAEINALAVGPSGGAVLPIKVTVLTPGDGRVYVAGVPEAGEGFGPSAQIALYVASRLSNVSYLNYTVLLRVLSSDSQVGGPSASGYITTAIYALVNGLELRNDTAMTGIILPDGIIGPVGGVAQKAQAAASQGIKTVLVPLGEVPRVSGARVVEIGTIYDAIYHLTGRLLAKPQATHVDDRVFRQVSKNLLDAVYRYYNDTIRQGYVDIATVENLKARDMYYTAASIIYRGIVNYYTDTASTRRSTMYNQALQTARDAERQLESIPTTVNNIDLVVASYVRIFEIYLQANGSSPDVGTMYARAVTLKPWIDEARRMAFGPAIGGEGLEELARMYLDYARGMYAYVETTYGVKSSDMSAAVQLSEALYRRGYFLASMANSIDVIARSASILMSRAPDKYATVARDLALWHMASAERCGYTNTIPLSYLQFGDYFNSRGDAGSALTYYILASIYSTAMGEVVCRFPQTTVFAPHTTPLLDTPVYPANSPEKRDIWLVLLIALAAIVALIYASRR